MIQIPNPIITLFTDLRSAHPQAEIFMVGGAVRDALLSRPYKDYDFVVRGVPIDDLEQFLSTRGRTNLVGKRFGVIKFSSDAIPDTIDIALPRTERSLSFSGAYRDFDVQSDHTLPIEQDLSRRDFTINALAYDLITNTLIDPFLGQKDLAKQIIRTVGSPVTRFQEDYSRILRALRFACVLDFHISDKTKLAISKMAFHVNDQIDGEWVVAREVMAKEFLKAFQANPLQWLNLADDFGLLALLLPEIKTLQTCKQSPPHHHEGTAYTHTTIALKALSSPEFKKRFSTQTPSLLAKLGVLFHDIGKPASASIDDDNIIHFYGHAKTGAQLMKTISKRLALGSSAELPINTDLLIWIVKNHLFSIEQQGNKIKKTKIEELFFKDQQVGIALLQTMLADQLASWRADNKGDTSAFDALQTLITDLAPDGNLPDPLINGDDILTWTNLKQGEQIGAILNDVREQQLNRIITTKAEAKAYLLKKHV